MEVWTDVCALGGRCREGASGDILDGLVHVHDKDTWPAVPTWKSSLLKAEKVTAIAAHGKGPTPRDGLVCDGKARGLVIRQEPAQGCNPMEK